MSGLRVEKNRADVVSCLSKEGTCPHVGPQGNDVASQLGKLSLGQLDSFHIFSMFAFLLKFGPCSPTATSDKESCFRNVSAAPPVERRVPNKTLFGTSSSEISHQKKLTLTFLAQIWTRLRTSVIGEGLHRVAAS